MPYVNVVRDLIYVAIATIAVVMILRISETGLHELFSLIRHELDEFHKRRFDTAASINFLGFLVITLLAALIFFASKAASVIAYFATKLNPDKVQQYKDALDPLIAIGVPVCVLFVSLLIVSVPNKKPRARRKR